MTKKTIRPLRSEADYDAALAEIECYFDREPKPGSADADRFDLLTLVIDDYERTHWPIDPPEPVDAIRFQMEMRGYSQADLGRVLGTRQRAFDILHHKRPLTLEMAWKLHQAWGIPAESLIRPRSPVRARGRQPSSAILDFDYDEDRRELCITYVGGKKYVYLDVPEEAYDALQDASSRGTYVNTMIKPHYEVREVTRRQPRIARVAPSRSARNRRTAARD